MFRLFRMLGRRQLPDWGQPEPVPSERDARKPGPRVTPDMAFKLFGAAVFEPKPEPSPPPPPRVRIARDEPTYTYPQPKAARAPAPTLLERAAKLADDDPVLGALLAAPAGAARQGLAAQVPGLGEPKPYLSELENELLASVYVQGLNPKTVCAQVQVGFSVAMLRRAARQALLRAVYYTAFPDEAAVLVPHPDHLALGRFVLAKSLEERRFTAKRHPELLAASERLPEREAMVLRLRHLLNLTLAEVGEHLGVHKERIRQLENKALRRLKHHYTQLKAVGPGPKAEKKIARQRFLLGHAATAVSFYTPEVRDCLANLGVFENPATAASPTSDPRLLALQAAPGSPGRRAVFAAHPELRPPHGFLTNAENRLLDWLYVRGAAPEGVQRALGVSAGRVAQLEERALTKLAYYLAFEMLLSFPEDDF